MEASRTENPEDFWKWGYFKLSWQAYKRKNMTEIFLI